MAETPTEAEKLRKIASAATSEVQELYQAMIEKLHASVVDGLIKEQLPVTHPVNGVSAAFTVAVEQALAFLTSFQYEARLKDEFQVIKKHRGYPK